jgi:hypothetical protein
MKKLFYLFALAGLTLVSCEKNNNSLPIQAQEFVINSTSSTAWKYFSFTKNDTVSVSDPATSTDWDLAFQRYRVKTNGGISGNGKGSAANSYKKLQAGFDMLKLIPDTTTFAVDQAIQIAVQQGYATYNVNPVLYTWFNIELGANGTQIVPTDYVYIVKTATGKYAKVWFKSYYSATNVSGYVTFDYKYQPDGSKNLE